LETITIRKPPAPKGFGLEGALIVNSTQIKQATLKVFPWAEVEVRDVTYAVLPKASMAQLTAWLRYLWKQLGAEYVTYSLSDFEAEYRDCDNFAMFWKGVSDGLPIWGGSPRAYAESGTHAFNLFIAEEDLSIFLCEPQAGGITGPITQPEKLEPSYRPRKIYW